MAFKTDTIRLKAFANDTARDNASLAPADGELCVSNGNLQIYDSSAWSAVDSSSALTISNFHADTYQTAAEVAGSFGDNDTSFLTSAATDDRIDSKVLVNANTVKHDAWSGNLELGSGSTVNNVVFYNTTQQGNTHTLTIPPPTDYPPMAQVQVINGSSEDMHITKKAGGNPDFNWQSGGGSVSQIDIGIGQRVLFLKTSGSSWDVITLSL